MSHRTAKPGRKHAGHDEEHENHERWLVTYADMLTLLMVLFIVMFAMSQVDQKKFAALKAGLAVGFGAPAITITTDTAPLSSGGAADATVSAPDPAVAPGLSGPGANGGSSSSSSSSSSASSAASQAVATAERVVAEQRAAAAQQEADNLTAVQQAINAELAKRGLAGNVDYTLDQRGLVITVVSSSVVFAGDRADLQPGGQRIVDAILPVLAKLPNNVEVDGHTNQLPGATTNYPSAWELSTARASTVVRYLVDHGIAAHRLSAAGFAGTRPLYPVGDPRAASRNRRVDIIVLSSLPPDQRALLGATAK